MFSHSTPRDVVALMIVVMLALSACAPDATKTSQTDIQAASVTTDIASVPASVGVGQLALWTQSSAANADSPGETRLESAVAGFMSLPQIGASVARIAEDQSSRNVVAPPPRTPVANPVPTAKNPLNKTYAPTRPKLDVSKPAGRYTPVVFVEGYETHIYAKSSQGRTLVASEPTRRFPGMFEKYVRISPDGRTVVYATAPKPLTDEMDVWLVDIDGENKRLLLTVPWELWSAEPVWSPDSKRLAYVRAQSPGKKARLELWTINADGSGNRRLLAHPSFNTSLYFGPAKSPLRWTEYGDLQYSNYSSGKVWTVDGETGAPTYQKAALKTPDPGIPVIETDAPLSIFSQNDPRWRYDRINPCADTMGNSGCAINTVAMSFTAHGVKTNPKKLNQDLEDFACPIYWAWASDYHSEKKLELWGMWAFDWNVLDLSLREGRPAMVMLADAFTSEDALLLHWVLVVGGEGQSPEGYRIYDPWDGTTYKTLDYYVSKGYNLQRVYTYAPKAPPKPVKSAAPKDATQP